jgi:hypothetical protein
MAELESTHIDVLRGRVMELHAMAMAKKSRIATNEKGGAERV